MDHRIVQAVRIIERHMVDDVQFGWVAEQVGLSVSRLHHLFAAEVGTPPATYLRRLRLEAAVHRLRWSDETVGRIAAGLGYASQASFTHAFVDRFGATPQRFRRSFREGLIEPGPGDMSPPLAVREVSGFRVLTRRYVGSLHDVRQYWTDFWARLPGRPERWRSEIFLGLLYDDPRTTSDVHARYDCCVKIGEAASFDQDQVREAGLHVTTTRAGLYATLPFAGRREDVEGTYRMLCDHWARASRYTITEDPAIELHAGPRHHMPPEALRFTILLPLE